MFISYIVFTNCGFFELIVKYQKILSTTKSEFDNFLSKAGKFYIRAVGINLYQN